MGEVVDAVSQQFDDAIIVTDVGQQQMFASRYFRFKRSRSIITSGGLGTMGYGLPAAIGAKIGMPEREVCLFVGDGGLQMTSQELGTMYQSQVGVKIVLMNNGYLGMVRQWQELFYDRRYSFTELVNPDFELLAKAEPDDLVKFGIIPELVGRMPVITCLQSLSKDDLVRILVEPKNALAKQYKKLLSLDNVELEIRKDALDSIAQKAVERKIGARGLRSIMESIMMKIMYRIPSDLTIRKVIITPESVNGGDPEIIRDAAHPREKLGSKR